jgi:hypothetical protein
MRTIRTASIHEFHNRWCRRRSALLMTVTTQKLNLVVAMTRRSTSLSGCDRDTERIAEQRARQILMAVAYRCVGAPNICGAYDLHAISDYAWAGC